MEEVSTHKPWEKSEYKIMITMSNNFDDYSFGMEKIKYYLSEKIRTHKLIMIKSDTFWIGNVFIDKICELLGCITETYTLHKGRDKQNVFDEMISEADALIAFWNGKSLGVENIINKAKEMNKKIAMVRIPNISKKISKNNGEF